MQRKWKQKKNSAIFSFTYLAADNFKCMLNANMPVAIHSACTQWLLQYRCCLLQTTCSMCNELVSQLSWVTRLRQITPSLDHLFQLSVKAQIFQCLANYPLHFNMTDLLRSPECSCCMPFMSLHNLPICCAIWLGLGLWLGVWIRLMVGVRVSV